MATGLEIMVALHKAQLGDAAKLFPAAADADFLRHLDQGAKRFTLKRPLLKRDRLTLIADQSVYEAPEDMNAFSRHEWGAGMLAQFRPWNLNWPGPCPEISEVLTDESLTLVFTPAPSAHQIAMLGDTFWFWYYARIEVLCVLPQDEPLLLLAALIEAVRELSTRNVANPIQLHKGMVPTSTALTPLAWFQELEKEWERTP